MELIETRKQLPEENKLVLIYYLTWYSKVIPTLAYYTKGKWCLDNHFNPQDFEVLAWGELPELEHGKHEQLSL